MFSNLLSFLFSGLLKYWIILRTLPSFTRFTRPVSGFLAIFKSFSFTSLQEPTNTYTLLCFLDACPSLERLVTLFEISSIFRTNWKIALDLISSSTGSRLNTILLSFLHRYTTFPVFWHIESFFRNYLTCNHCFWSHFEFTTAAYLYKSIYGFFFKCLCDWFCFLWFISLLIVIKSSISGTFFAYFEVSTRCPYQFSLTALQFLFFKSFNLRVYLRLQVSLQIPLFLLERFCLFKFLF